MMKTLLYQGLLLLMTGSLFAQGVVTEVIVASGGKFSDPTDWATIGVYNAATGQYTVFDSLKTSSVQDVKIANGRIYLASADTLAVYDAAAFSRDTLWHYPNIGRLYVDGDVLAATKLFGDSTIPVLRLYHPTTYGLLLDVDSPDVAGITGITRVGDSLYFSYNIKGTIDLYPPYGVYADSIGALLHVNLNTPALENNIVLDTNAAGLSELVTVFDTLVAGVAKETQNIVMYFPKSGGFGEFYDSMNTQEVVLTTPSMVYAVGKDSLGNLFVYWEDVVHDTQAVLYNMGPSSWGKSIAAVAVDTLHSKVYYSRTDYVTWGKVYVADFGAAAPSDSFTVGIAPEAIAIQYRQVTGGVAEVDNRPLQVVCRPNPAVEEVRFSWPPTVKPVRLEVYSVQGRRMAGVSRPVRNTSIDVRQWPAGTYYVRTVFEDGRTASTAFRKQ